jgi:hypothetical protein
MRVGEGDRDGVFVDPRGQLFGRDHLQFDAVAQQPLEPLHHIEVGGEVPRLGQDRPTPRSQRHRARQQLEEVHRGGVGRHHLVRLGADQRGDLAADPLRRLDPVGGVPAAHHALAPLLRDHLGQPRRGGFRQGAQGVAVEVEGVGRDDEVVAEVRQRVLVVQAFRLAAGGPVHA